MTCADKFREIAVSVTGDLAARDAVKGVLLVGSTAIGYADEYSDIDLQVVGQADAGERSIEGIHVEWTPITFDELEAKLDSWDNDAALYTYAHTNLLYDQLGLADLFATYDGYPPEIRRKKLYSGWFYGTGNAFDARKAEQRGDPHVKRCASVNAVEQFAALTYVLDEQFPPYRKWLFRDLPMELPEIDAALAGDGEALDAIASTLEPELREHLTDDRVENPYLYQPQYERLG
ncbi:DUF4037 domain-containing protein [Haladaptatus sp. DYF46]|uniref:DUF4037 domain-containing protein n=1 Tax=Haladaptatus sp. DYF46 TaxID=2886041 RepID=UPI001E2A4EFC|nr:DUF4037 domain-containing protein [Haladaptatus sp. DYF46]